MGVRERISTFEERYKESCVLSTGLVLQLRLCTVKYSTHDMDQCKIQNKKVYTFSCL